MKNIFKKVSAIAASALMVGMSMGIAAAATTYPAPFVEGGAANVAIVYGTGTGVAESDYIQAGFIQTNLGTSVTNGGTPSGESVLIERSTDKFNLMNNMSSFYSKLDDGELPLILADGVYSNDEHDDFKYTQEIVIAKGIQLKHFLDSKFNDDKPLIGFDLSSGSHLLNYTLKFTPDDAEGTDSSWTGITGSEIPLFSTPYYVLAMSNTSASNHKITLLNSAASATLNKEESITLTTDDGSSYAVSIFYLDGTNVKLIINGETTDSLIATQTQKLQDGSYVGIKEVASEGYATGESYVEFSIGTGKLVLENEKEVEMNNEKISKTDYAIVGSDETVSYKITSYLTTSGTNLDKIVLDWELDDESWLAPGTEMTLPGFETVKLSMSEFVTSVGEVTTIEGDSSKFEIKTVVTEGALTLPIFYLQSNSTGILGLGKDSTHQLVSGNGSVGTTALHVTAALNETRNNFFVVSWIDGDESECYAYELEDVDEDNKNTTTLRSMVTGGSDITLDEVGDYDTVGNVKFTLGWAHEKQSVNELALINITAASSGNVYIDTLVTADGLTMTLPVENGTDNWLYNSAGFKAATDVATTQLRSINTSGTVGQRPITWQMNVTEEDKNGNIAQGKSFEVTLAFSGTDGLEPSTITHAVTSTIMYETEDTSKLYVGYVPSDLGTKLEHYKPSSGLNDLTITYWDEETYGKVYLTEKGSVLVGDGALGEVRVMDSQVSTVSSLNLIVVGGSCINSAAATLVGSAACTADWTTATGVGSGEFLIQSFGATEQSLTSKIALLVAGYSAADTINAVTYLRANTLDVAGGNKYKSTSQTTAELVVT